MKKQLLSLVLTFGLFSVINAQNWTFEGNQKFTSFASDGAITHNSAGNTFVAFADVLDANKVHVKKYDGNSWVSVGSGAASTGSADLISITTNPTTGQPWIAYKNTTSEEIDVIKFDGATWSLDGSFSNGTDVAAYQTQIKVSGSGVAYVTSTTNAYANQNCIFYTNKSGTWAPVFTQVVSGTVDLLDTNSLYYNKRNYPTGTATYKRTFNGTSWTAPTLVKDAKNVGYSPAAISIATTSDWLNQVVTSGVIYETPAGSKTYSSTNIASNSTAYSMKFRKNAIDDGMYLFYLDNASNVVLKKRTAAVWSTLPTAGIDLSTLNNDKFAKMSINPVTGNIHVVYNDAGQISVKYYKLPPALSRVYVDENAVGTGDGSSWQDAYTDLTTALKTGVGSTTTEVWIAKGVYTPDASDRTISFGIDKKGLAIYGGFAGTETTLSERDPSLNLTVLSGDLSGNDDNTISFTNALRSENSFCVVRISADSTLLDGLTIVDGHANGSTGQQGGGALIKDPTVNTLNLVDCVFKNNVGTKGGGAVFSTFSVNGSALIQSCEFSNNLATYGGAYYIYPVANDTITVEVQNSLFTNNRVSNSTGSSNDGYGGSAGWVRAYGASSKVAATFVNNTYAQNSDIGSHSSAVGHVATLGISQTSGVMEGKVYNCIFWDNTGANNAVAKAVDRINSTFPATLIVTNSLDEDAFSAVTVKLNYLSTDPMFVSNTDFSIQSGSVAENAGDNSKVPAGLTTDFDGGTRILNTTVDMGAYEQGNVITNVSETVLNSVRLFPNPSSDFVSVGTEVAIESIKVLDLNGKQVYFEKGDIRTIDVSGFVAGIYLFEVKQNGNANYFKLAKK